MSRFCSDFRVGIGALVAYALVYLASGYVAALAAQGTSSGQIRIGAPRFAGDATLVHELTIGSANSDPRTTFTVPLLSPATGGGVFVIDLADPTGAGGFTSRVMKFDRHGKLETTFGRNGDGPGEYTFGVGDVEELPDGRVVLSDPKGLLVYRADGVWLDRWRVRSMKSNIGEHILVHPGGWVLTWTWPADRMGPLTSEMPNEMPRALHCFSWNGDDLGALADPRASMPDSTHRIGAVAVPYKPLRLVTWSPLGYFVTSNSRSWDLRLHPSARNSPGRRCGEWHNGDRVVSLVRSLAPPPVSSAERSDWGRTIEVLSQRLGSTVGPMSAGAVPVTKPVVREVSIALDGRIWVQISQPSELYREIAIVQNRQEAYDAFERMQQRWWEPMVFDVFEPSGEYVGRVRFPREIRRLSFAPSSRVAISGDTVWAVVADSLDVQTVRRYQVRWGR